MDLMEEVPHKKGKYPLNVHIILHLGSAKHLQLQDVYGEAVASHLVDLGGYLFAPNQLKNDFKIILSLESLSQSKLGCIYICSCKGESQLLV